jgi:K+-sensing histidine kinase KdpD
MALHGGSVSYLDTAGGGARFVLRLPLESDASADVHKAGAGAGATAAAPTLAP